MEFPARIGVMILSGCSLFPGAVQPLFIFEPRYRAMLADALDSHRLFCLAMQNPGAARESPCEVAGVGVIRASVKNANGTSNMILQGLGRVRLGRQVQAKPYRVHEIEPLTAPLKLPGEMDALVERTLDLVDARLRLGCQVPLEVFHQLAGGAGHAHTSVEQCVRALRGISDPGTMADLVTTLLLTEPDERQVILENVDPESRLKNLVRFLTGEIHRARKASAS